MLDDDVDVSPGTARDVESGLATGAIRSEGESEDDDDDTRAAGAVYDVRGWFGEEGADSEVTISWTVVIQTGRPGHCWPAGNHGLKYIVKLQGKSSGNQLIYGDALCLLCLLLPIIRSAESTVAQRCS